MRLGRPKCVSLVSLPTAGKTTLSSRWKVVESSCQFSHDLSSGAKPCHCTKTICCGGVMDWSSLVSRIVSGWMTGWLLKVCGGSSSSDDVSGPWCGLSKEQWKTGCIFAWVGRFERNQTHLFNNFVRAIVAFGQLRVGGACNGLLTVGTKFNIDEVTNVIGEVPSLLVCILFHSLLCFEKLFLEDSNGGLARW